MISKTCLGVLYLHLFLVLLFRTSHCLDPIIEVTTPKPATISPFGNVTLPIIGNLSAPSTTAGLTFPTIPTLNLGNFTLPTLPPLANFTMPTFGTLPPLNLSVPALPTMAPLNLTNLLGNMSIPTFGTMPPLGNFTIPTMLPLGNFTLPTFATMAPLNLTNLLGNLSMPTMGTLPPLNLSFPTFATMAPLNLTNLLANMSIPTMATIAPLNLTNLLGNLSMPTLGTMAPIILGNFTLPTFATMAPLNLSNLPTLPTLAPLNLSMFTLPPMPTMAPLGNFTFGTLPTLIPALTLPSLNGTTMMANVTATPVLLGGVTIPGNVTLMPMMTTTKPAGNVTMMQPAIGNVTLVGNMTIMTTIHGAVGNVTMLPMNMTMMPGNMTMMPMMTTIKLPGAAPVGNVSLPALNMTMMPTLAGMTTPKAGNMTMLPMNMTMMPTVAGNVTLMPMMTTTKPAVPGNATVPAMTTLKPGATTPCDTATCTSDQVCASPFNSSQVCTKRLPDRRYCIDNPCVNGMKCFDNVTSNAYTCYTKLDGAAGECMGIQCSPGDICYQVMGQQAKCIQLHQAPRCLGQNEEFSACKSGCESTCSEPVPACMNTTTCTSGCACIRGYVRTNGVCQLMSTCPSMKFGNTTCAGNEMYTSCKPVCEKSCSGVPNMACQLSLNSTTTTMAPSKCVPGCTCLPPYKRDTATGQCVHARQCYSATTCGMNESWSRCHNCEAMCGQTANPSCKTCWSGCGCNTGYSRSTNGTCVATAKCF